jgi:hypothetical protein
MIPTPPIECRSDLPPRIPAALEFTTKNRTDRYSNGVPDPGPFARDGRRRVMTTNRRVRRRSTVERMNRRRRRRGEGRGGRGGNVLPVDDPAGGTTVPRVRRERERAPSAMRAIVAPDRRSSSRPRGGGRFGGVGSGRRRGQTPTPALSHLVG